MPIPRVQLFELEDQRWFPNLIRDFATDWLQHFAESALGLHRPVVPTLRDALLESDSRQIIDLCSGGSGPMLPVQKALRAEGLSVRATLTDKFPNLEAFERARSQSGNMIEFVPESVDARAVPRELKGFRTIFNSFHHFRPEDARTILRDAVAANQPIGIFELPERSLPIIASVLLTAPIMVLFMTPFIRPFRWRRLFWTYVLPLVPLTCVWDGVVSHLRAYSLEELEDFARELRVEHYMWKAGRIRIPSTPAHVTYLVGYPWRSHTGVNISSEGVTGILT